MDLRTQPARIPQREALISQRGMLLLDRDGVLIKERHYLNDPDAVELESGAVELIALMNQHAIPVAVVSNQSGLARGLISQRQLDQVHQRLHSLLKEGGAHLDGIYVCPHHPEGSIKELRQHCDCRKPRIALLKQAAAAHAAKLQASLMVGDKLSDIEAGNRAGCSTVLVRTGYGQESEKALDAASDLSDLSVPDAVMNSLYELYQQLA